MKPFAVLLSSITSLLVISTAQGATVSWTTGGTGSGTWDGTGATFNGTAYNPIDTLDIDGSLTKTITVTGDTPTLALLTVSGTGTTGNTITGGAGAPGAGAITLTGTSVGGPLTKTATSTADLVLASANSFDAVTLNGGKFFLNNAAGLGTTGTLTVNNTAPQGVTGSYAVATMGSFFYDSSNLNASYTFSKNITFGSAPSATTFAMAMRGGATRTTTVSGNISGESNITLWLDTSTGSDLTSVWSLTGDNSNFAGRVRLNRGRLILANANAGGTGSIFIQTNTNPTDGNLVLNFSGTFATNIVLGTTTNQGISTGANNVNYTGILSNDTITGSWVKGGSGTLTLSNANTLTGGTSLTGGTLALANALALKNSTLTTGGGAVVFDQSVSGNAFTLGGLAGAGSLALQNNAAVPDPVALTVGGNNAATTYSGSLTGPGSLIKNGTATLTLSGTNSFTGGMEINGGSITANSVAALGSGTISANRSYAATYASGGAPFLNMTATGAVDITNNLVVQAPGATSYYAIQKGTLGSSLTLSGTISGGNANSILQLDTPNGGDSTTMYTLSGNNTVAGQIRLNRGRLFLTNANAAGAASIFIQTNTNANGNLVFSNSFTLANNIIIGTIVNDTISPGINNVELSGSISGTAVWGKVGTGDLTLTGTNTFAGGVTVNTGNLFINGNSSGTAGVNTVAAGAILGGTGALGGVTTVNGTLLGGNGSIGTTLTLASDVTLTATSLITLALGSSGTHSTLALDGAEIFDLTQHFNFLSFGAAPGTYPGVLTGIAADPGTLADWQIANADWTGTFTYDAEAQAIDFNLAAVPEPGVTVAMLGGLATLLGLRRRRN